MSTGKYVTALHNHFQKLKNVHLLSWKESSEGPADALTWTAQCKVDGEVFATGSASQLRVAKELAAQTACERLGIFA